MQVSSKILSSQKTQEVIDHLVVAICEITKPTQAHQFITDFLTATEQTVLAKRLTIGILLKQKIAYEDIKKTLNVSSATISGVAAMMKKPGFKLAIEKINQDAWAEIQMQKLTKLFKK